MRALDMVKTIAHRLSDALRQNRRFAIVAGLIVLLTVDAMAAYAFSRPAGVVLPAEKRLSFAGDTFGYRLCYDGRMYYSSISLSQKTIGTLRGRRLGEASGDYASLTSLQLSRSRQIYSDASPLEVYTARGYDKNIRLVGVYPEKRDGTYGVLFVCESGITVKTGADYLGRYDLKNNTRRVEYTEHDVNATLWNRFINALYCAPPVSAMEMNVLYSMPLMSGKTLNIESGSGLVQPMYIEKGGYVSFGLLTFKMDGMAFDEFWNALK